MQYRRTRAHGGTYFFTVVTHLRRRFLCEPGNVAILREAFRSVMAEHPVQMDAIVVLPDHMHAVWTLPANDCDYSTRWRLVKTYFSRRSHVPLDGPIAGSRLRKKERTVWQRRFWEHLVRDDEDLIAQKATQRGQVYTSDRRR
jgi:putative transposase